MSTTSFFVIYEHFIKMKTQSKGTLSCKCLHRHITTALSSAECTRRRSSSASLLSRRLYNGCASSSVADRRRYLSSL